MWQSLRKSCRVRYEMLIGLCWDQVNWWSMPLNVLRLSFNRLFFSFTCEWSIAVKIICMAYSSFNRFRFRKRPLIYCKFTLFESWEQFLEGVYWPLHSQPDMWHLPERQQTNDRVTLTWFIVATQLLCDKFLASRRFLSPYNDYYVILSIRMRWNKYYCIWILT